MNRKHQFLPLSTAVVKTETLDAATSCGSAQSVVVLSFPRYCRYRSIARRIEGATEHWMQTALVAALGGILGVTVATRVLFCKETFDYPELEGHELLCNHLSPKLTGRPRKKRKKRSSSPGSESNESEGSSFSAGSSSGKETFDYPELEGHELLCNHLSPKLTGRPRKKRKKRSSSPGSESNESEGSSFSAGSSSGKVTRSGARQAASATSLMPQLAPPGQAAMPRTARMGARGSLTARTVSSSHATGSREEQEFLRGLYTFMEKQKSPIDRIPSLGFKQIDLFAFYKKVRGLGGYQQVTTRKLWKRVYDEMGGSQSNTSAATCTRKHYERLLLSYERRIILDQKLGKKPAEVKQVKPKPVHTITKPPPEQRRKSTSSLEDAPALKKRKLEILQQGGLEVTPIGQPPSTTPQSASAHRRSMDMTGSTAPSVGSNSQVSITVTPDVSHMLSADTFKTPPPHRMAHHMFSRTGRIYDNPKVDLTRDKHKPDLEVLDLTIKPSTSASLMLPPPSKIPELTILPHHNGHPLTNHNHQKNSNNHNNNHHHHSSNKSSTNSNSSKVKVPRASLNSSLEITLVNNSGSNSSGSVSSTTTRSQDQHNSSKMRHLQQQQQQQQQQLNNYHSKLAAANSPFNIPLFPDPTMYYAALYNSRLYQGAPAAPSLTMPPGSVSPHELYKSLLSHHAASFPLLASLNQSYPGLPRDGSTSITPLPKSKK
ncbi:UNVERIFIED_CONTAM: hypothetical protein B566_EDAN017652 [Ephemera danica]|nr:hypothetical protein B566_EDAN017652 [Ephemera danica]